MKLNWKQYLNRSLIVIFWIGLIFGILYWPKGLFFREKKSINVFAWGDILDPSVVAEFEKSLKRYPPISPGTPDPYQPPQASP